jgi:nitrous oxidase accessory protein NosD
VFVPPFEGAGVFVGVELVADLVGIEAERNVFAGLVLGSTVQPGVALYRVDGGRFADNGVGIAAIGGEAVDVEIAGAEASGNAAAGFALPNLRHGTVRGVTASGNATGITANVAAGFEVRESEVALNQEGVLLVVQPGAAARLHCSNVRGNAPGAGLRLLSGAAADARANFWGDPSGPAHPANPGGLGDPVVDGANGGDGAVGFTGFLAAEATAGDCIEPSPVEVPAAGTAGLALLAALLALAGLGAVIQQSREL